MDRRAAVFLTAVMWVAGPATWLAGMTGEARAQFGLPSVSVAKVIRKPISAGQPVVGSVVPIKRSTIGSAVDGRVIEFPVNAGDFVRKGQVLAQLRTETTEIELAAAQAEYRLREEELRELKNGSRPEEIDQTRSKMLGLKARMEYTAAKLRRFQTLFAKGNVSKEDLDEAGAAAEEADQSLHEAEATYKLAIAGPRPERIAQMEARVAMQREAVRQIEDRLEKFTVRAYYDGYVVSELTEVGHWVKQGEAIAEMVALDQVEVRAMVLENYIPQVFVGMKVPVQINALPTQGPFTGEITQIVPQADLRSRSFPVLVRVANPPVEAAGRLIKAGMMAHILIPGGKPEEADLIPKDAVVLGGAKPLVYVYTPKGDGKTGLAHPTPVRLGIAEGTLVQVFDLPPQAQSVVVLGNERLFPKPDHPEIEVQVLAPDAAPPATPGAKPTR